MEHRQNAENCGQIIDILLAIEYTVNIIISSINERKFQVKYSIKVTREELDHIIRGLEMTMGDYLDDDHIYHVKENAKIVKENAKIQKFIDKLEKEFKG